MVPEANVVVFHKVGSDLWKKNTLKMEGYP